MEISFEKLLKEEIDKRFKAENRVRIDVLTLEAKTGLSKSTINRFMGYEKSNSNSTYDTLNRLSKAIGFESWENFCAIKNLALANSETKVTENAVKEPSTVIFSSPTNTGQFIEEKSIKTEQNPYWSKTKVVVVTLITLAITTLSVILYYYNDAKAKSVLEANCKFSMDDTTSLKILIMPFKPDIQCKELDIDYRSQILERLSKKKNEDNLSIKILTNLCDTAKACPLTTEDANKIGKSVNADMVIWGSYEENQKGISGLRLRYTLLSNAYVDKSFKSGDTEMKSLNNLHQLREGYLQKDIDYIIYWLEGLSSFKKGNYKNALNYFSLIQTNYKNNFYDYETHLKLGEIYYELSLPDSSIKHYQFAKIKLLKTKNISNKLLSKIYTNIGANYVTKGEYKKAENLTNDAIKMQLNDAILSKDDISRTYRIIGHLNFYRGNFVKALENYNKSLNQLIELTDKNYYDFSVSFLNITNAYIQLNNLDSALKYVYADINIRKKYLYSQPMPIIQSNNLLGHIYIKKQLSDSALKYYTENLKIQKNILFPNHPLFITTHFNIGSIYGQKKYFNKALVHTLHALELKKKSNNGAYDIFYVYIYSNLGGIYTLLNNNIKAIENLQIAKKIANSISISKYHTIIGDLNSNMAEAYNKIGKYSLAKKNIDEAILIYKKNNYDDKNPQMIKALKISNDIDVKTK